MSLNSQDTAEYRSDRGFRSGFFVPPSPAVHAEFGAATHVGRVRAINEDHFAVFRRTRSQEIVLTNLTDGALQPFQEESYCLVVADGMGGKPAGEFASRVAIERAWDLTDQASSWVMRLRSLVAQQVNERVEAFMTEMHRTLRELEEADPDLAGMGTTWTSVYLVGWHALIAQVGDSRAYLWRQETLRLLTRDQTLAQVLIDSGVPPEETRGVRHVLTNTLGGREKIIVPDVDHLRLQDGDRLLLCTDGLSDQMSDGELADVLRQRLSPQASCDALIQLALDHGGKDNITAIIAEFVTRQ